MIQSANSINMVLFGCINQCQYFVMLIYSFALATMIIDKVPWEDILYITINNYIAACRAPLDIVFLIDGSRSIERHGVGNFRREISMVKHITAGFLVSRTYTRVGLVVYGTNARTIFGLNNYRNNVGLFNALGRSIRNPQTGSRIGRALYAAQNIFSRYVYL